MSDPTLHGRCALVTGSTSGLGLAIATGLARAGCRVMLTGLEDAAAAEPIRSAMVAETGAAVAYHHANLAHEAEVRRLVDTAAAQLGAVDILVNNAVVRHFAPVEAFPVDRWELALAVNLSAAFHAIRLLLPAMRARGWGRIVNMSSIYGSRGVTGRIDYVTTKTALLGLTRGVALETAGEPITCNAICPGSVSTPGTESRVERLMQEEGLPREEAVRRFLAGKQPTGRFVPAENVVGAILFLCSAAASDLTGAVLPIDGGWLAG